MKQCHWLGYNHKRGKKSFFKDETDETIQSSQPPPPEKIKKNSSISHLPH
jgi:hypothetical protein